MNIPSSWYSRGGATAYNLSERMTQTLEQQVAEKELALREQFKRLTRYEKEQALIGERERIMRDMEDHGIELEWCVTELPQVGDFSPRRSLHIMHIVQEAA
jgi:hypothetical protein